MSPEIPNSADAIFGAALELPPEEREAHLIDACGDNLELLAEVRVLLAAHEEVPTKFLDSPTVKGAFDATIAADGSGKTSGKPTGSKKPKPSSTVIFTEKEGDVIGSYKLLQQIGEGGFGTVWMAEQSEPISRKVALKVIKAGMDTREVLARFEAERQALALMDHTHIAKVLDAGATSSGRPWFAMELVKGIPITEFCDEKKLATRQRLELFGDVCSAINHAHQKGVIHRDIKPNNVMVTLHGDKPVVKVIDFGIAKATQSKLTNKTLFTAFEQMLGTPIYMSPEQAGLSRLDIDTRSDIYSLGVLLYELLTGKPPFDGKSLISAGYEEMRRIIREEEPPRPSVRLSTVAEEDNITRITNTHGAEPQKLSRLVRGELDWIVMKAIEKDRARRYETANAFAADIGRYLNDEPVQAAAPSAAYKFKKFARRNKAAIGTAALITVVLIAATGVSTWQAIEAHRARVQSDKDKEDAESISSYLVGVFQSPDPAREGRTITVAETLDAAVEKLETDLTDQPERKAKLQKTLGSTYGALGLFREAIPLQEKRRDYHLAASGPEHPDTLSAMNNLALSYMDAGRRDDALAMQEEVLALSRKVSGPEHPDTIKAMSNLASSYRDVGRGDEAIAMLEELLPLSRRVHGEEHPDTLGAMGNLAVSYHVAGRRDEALELLEEVLALSRKVSGPEHPDTIKAMSNLALSYRDTGRLDEALKLREEVSALSRKVLGSEHPDTLMIILNLATSYRDAGRLDEALKLGEEVLAISRKVLGPEHPDTIKTMNNLATIYHETGRLEEALKLREEVLALSRKVLGPEHPDTIKMMNNLATSYHETERLDEEITLREMVIELDPEHAEAHCNLGVVLGQQGELDKAIASCQRAIELDPEYAKAHSNLGAALFQQGKTEDAIEAYQRAIELDLSNQQAMANLVVAHAKLGQVDRCGIWFVRFFLAKGMEDDAALVKQIPLAFFEINAEFPVAENPQDEAIANYYENHADAFRDTSVHLRMISGAKPAKTRELMETLRKELIDGGDFATTATEHSDDSDDSAASDGGDRGWVKRGDLQKDLSEAAFALKVGGFSEVIEDATHFRLLNVVERKEGTPPPLNEVREKVIAALKEEAQTARIKGWIEEAKKELAADRKAREEYEGEGKGDE